MCAIIWLSKPCSLSQCTWADLAGSLTIFWGGAWEWGWSLSVNQQVLSDFRFNKFLVLKLSCKWNECMFTVWDKIEESEKPTQAARSLTTAGFFLLLHTIEPTASFLVTHDSTDFQLDMAVRLVYSIMWECLCSRKHFVASFHAEQSGSIHFFLFPSRRSLDYNFRCTQLCGLQCSFISRTIILWSSPHSTR